MSEYIRFDETTPKPKTKVYSVVNKKSGYRIGEIKWHGPWRQYCLFPEDETIFNNGCMHDIIEFITKLMEERKKWTIYYHYKKE